MLLEGSSRMAEALDVVLSTHLESRFCDPNSIKPRSYRKLTSRSIDPTSKLGSWKKYLAGTIAADDAQSDHLFDLPEQDVIHEDCQRFVDELDIPEDDKPAMLTTLRTIITIYSKSENITYKIKNGWIPLLGRLIPKNNSKFETYILFKTIREMHVPAAETHGFVVRLLLQYHDPELYNWIDTNEISLADCTETWFDTLFTSGCTELVCDLLWKYFIKSRDSFKIFFIVLSIIIQNRDIEIMKLDAKEKIKNTIELFPRFINTVDVEDILKFAKLYDTNTPPFFREAFGFFMFGDNREIIPESLPEYLPLSATSMLENLHFLQTPNIPCDYFIVDCRPFAEYDAGQFLFRRRYHIDCNILTTSPLENFIFAIRSLIINIRKAEDTLENREIHICLMGSRFATNDKCVLAVAKELLRRNRKYVSILYGGYKIIHDVLQLQGEFNDFSINHNDKKCIVCSPPKPRFVKKMRQRLNKSKKGLKRGLLSCVSPMDVNCTGKSEDIEQEPNTPTVDEDVSVNTKLVNPTSSMVSMDSNIHGLISRSISTKSERSSKQDSLPREIQFDMTSISKCLAQPNVKSFKCKEIASNGHVFKSLLLVTDINLIHLRMIEDLNDKAHLIINCHIFCIMDIRARERNEKMMIIRFDKSNKKMLIPFDEIRYLIRKKKEFVNLIEQKFRRDE